MDAASSWLVNIGNKKDVIECTYIQENQLNPKVDVVLPLVGVACLW